MNRALALTLAAGTMAACAEKTLVSDASAGRAKLGVTVGLASLAAEGEITAVRVSARFTNPSTNAVVAMGNITSPYAQGETRSVTLSVDLGECLQAVRARNAAADACPVQLSVEVLSDARVLARDELPIVNVRVGETATAPALSARGVQSVRLRVGASAPPTPFALVQGDTTRLIADALDVGGSPIGGRTITWASSTSTVATISNTGLITAIAPGTTTITASTGSASALVQQSVTLTVSAPVPAAVVVTPASATLDAGTTQTLTATVRDARGVVLTTPLTWSSSATTVATVSAAGVVTAVAPGTATITALTPNNVSGTATITVVAVPATVTLSPATAALLVGGTQTLTAVVRDAAGATFSPTPALSWVSNNTAVATVSSSGVVTAVALGTATITARTANNVAGTATINVSPTPASVSLAPTAPTIAVGATQQLTATVLDAAGATIFPTPALSWTSATPTVATVSATGVVTGVASGTSVITARTANGLSATTTVTVNGAPATITLAPTAPTVLIGSTVTVSATVRDSAGRTLTPSPTLSWTSATASVATVSTTGVVTGVAAGTSVITARAANGVSASVTVTVNPNVASITISPATVVLSVGQTQALSIVARDPSGALISPSPTVSWQSANASVATITALTGVVTAVGGGTTVITAQTASGLSATATVTVAQSGSFAGRVYDFETGIGIAGATVTATTSIGSRTLTTDATGNYNTGALTGLSVDLRIVANGYVSADYRNITTNGDRIVEATPLARTAGNNGSISGVLRDATTNLPLIGQITVELYAGQNVTTGTPIATTTNFGNDGFFFGSVPAGTYTLYARPSGYVPGSRTTVSLGNGRAVSSQNIVLSPVVAAGTLRIVLTWGDKPVDLDSHLTGPSPTGNFWVYWASTGSCTASPFVCLDVDQVSGRGPETITIARSTPGRYVYSVHNYSNEAPMNQSNALVQVYNSSGLLRTFTMPSTNGTLWTVFSYDGIGTITPINTVTVAQPPGSLVAGARAALQAMPQKPKRPPQ